MKNNSVVRAGNEKYIQNFCHLSYWCIFTPQIAIYDVIFRFSVIILYRQCLRFNVWHYWLIVTIVIMLVLTTPHLTKYEMTSWHIAPLSSLSCIIIHNSGHYVSFCLLFKSQLIGDWIISPSLMEPTQVGPIEKAGLWLRTPNKTPIGFINSTQRKPPVRFNSFTPWISIRLEPNLCLDFSL